MKIQTYAHPDQQYTEEDSNTDHDWNKTHGGVMCLTARHGTFLNYLSAGFYQKWRCCFVDLPAEHSSLLKHPSPCTRGQGHDDLRPSTCTKGISQILGHISHKSRPFKVWPSLATNTHPPHSVMLSSKCQQTNMQQNKNLIQCSRFQNRLFFSQ